jgi:hypothetical protein
MNFTRENYRMMRERLLGIIYRKPDPKLPPDAPYNEDVIEAATKLVCQKHGGIARPCDMGGA